MTRDAAVAIETFTAEVDREDRWWIIHVLELDVVTQAARWSEVEDMARGVIVATLDLDDAAEFDLELVPVFDDEAGRLLASAHEQEARAQELVASASTSRRAAVETLKAAGWTLQGIAAGLGLSYQRVEQLLKAEGRSPEEDTMKNRSAKSGRYISNAAAARHPKTSVREASGRNRSTRTAHRSATTGRYVTTSTARRNPSGTVTENGR